VPDSVSNVQRGVISRYSQEARDGPFQFMSIGESSELFDKNNGLAEIESEATE
jgi:hypothetical protein